MTHKGIIPIAAALVLFTAAITRAEQAGQFNVQLLLPGVTKSIELRQVQAGPLGCPQFFVFTIGSGMLGLSLKKDDVAGDAMFMTGFVLTGGRVVPLQRAGVSTGMIDQTVEIIGDANTASFAWIWCGIAASQNAPVYLSEFRLSFAP